jgi:hypothetical protein
MRNLLQYPITRDEIIDCLSRLREEALADLTIGGTDAACLQEAINFLSNWPRSQTMIVEFAHQLNAQMADENRNLREEMIALKIALDAATRLLADKYPAAEIVEELH